MKYTTFWDVTPCGSCNNDISEELRASIDETGTTTNKNIKNPFENTRYFGYMVVMAHLVRARGSSHITD
jgi:hypothetical protein